MNIIPIKCTDISAFFIPISTGSGLHRDTGRNHGFYTADPGSSDYRLRDGVLTVRYAEHVDARMFFRTYYLHRGIYFTRIRIETGMSTF